jgi:hypothetical protein
LHTKVTDRLLSTPSRAHAPAHQHTPTESTRRISQDGYVDDYEDVVSGSKKHETTFFGVHREPVRGRKWDHAREKEPVILQAGVIPTGSQWQTYIKSTMYGPSLSEDPKLVNQDFLQRQTPGYERPWRGDLENGGSDEKGSNIFRNKKKQRSMIMTFQVSYARRGPDRNYANSLSTT